jgi:hypothetical protein
MSDFEHRDREERIRLERIIERLVELLRDSLEKKSIAVSAKGELMPATIAVGGNGATFTFRELDVNGNTVPASGPITFASDTPSVAIIDAAAPVVNPDGSVSVQVDAVSAGTATISGVDPASQNQVAAADTLTVTASASGVAVSATGTLVANTSPVAPAVRTRQ